MREEDGSSRVNEALFEANFLECVKEGVKNLVVRIAIFDLSIGEGIDGVSGDIRIDRRKCARENVVTKSAEACLDPSLILRGCEVVPP
jgi:hypothetical protein